jgi:hypothetical protein
MLAADPLTQQRAGLLRRATAGNKQPVKAAPLDFTSDDWADALAALPNALAPSDIATLLNISRTESYRVAHAVGCLRIGHRGHLVRVPKRALERWLREAWAGAGDG